MKERKVLGFPDVQRDGPELHKVRDMMERFADEFADHCRQSGIPASLVVFEFEEGGSDPGAPARAVATVNLDLHPEYELHFEVDWIGAGGAAGKRENGQVVPLHEPPGER